MDDGHEDPLAGLFADEIIGFVTPGFHLGSDLIHLLRVRKVRAPEATVFYCARALEAIAAEALRRVGLKPSSNLFSNLELLQDYNLIPQSTRHWAHALRRIGNDVRHLNRTINASDADLSLLFVERWLEWYFQKFPYGHRLVSLTGGSGPMRLTPHDEQEDLRALIVSLESLGESPTKLVESLTGPRRDEFLKTSTLPAMLAEVCLDQGHSDDARRVLEVALPRYPNDIRLRQLIGLYYSRENKFEVAIDWLSPLIQGASDDGESAGILGGVYKRKWLQDPTDRESLNKSYQTYLEGWKRSRRTNTYPGINAATLALYCGRPAESRRIARQVCDLLEERVTAMSRLPEESRPSGDFWKMVSQAEAELLLGNLAESRRLYRRAFATHPHQYGSKNHEICFGQASKIAEAMGITFQVEPFTEHEQPIQPDRLILAITGHRTLPSLETLRKTLEAVVARWTGSRTAVLSALAEGADRLFAQVVLETSEGATLRAILPMEIADYSNDFKAEESTLEFRSLLSRSESITICLGTQSPQIDSPTARDLAYERCGFRMVDECDVLVAVWDGEKSRGQGGTADVVDYARRTGRPLVWVNSTPPHQVVYERF